MQLYVKQNYFSIYCTSLSLVTVYKSSLSLRCTFCFSLSSIHRLYSSCSAISLILLRKEVIKFFVQCESCLFLKFLIYKFTCATCVWNGFSRKLNRALNSMCKRFEFSALFFDYTTTSFTYGEQKSGSIYCNK